MNIVGLESAIAHIRRERPSELRLPADVIAKIRDELRDLSVIKESPRPVPGSHIWAGFDAQMWDEKQALMKRAPVTLMGIPVIEEPAKS